MGAITEASGAFVLYPSGAVAAAPSSKVALPGGQPGQIGVNPGITYDLAATKWLPVPYYWLAPGGKVYIYEDSKTGKTSVVDVSTGKARELSVPAGWFPFGLSDLGAYVQASLPGGAWFYPFDGSHPRLLVEGNYWLSYNSGSIWQLSPSGRLVRHDLTSGADKEVTTLSGWNEILGFDLRGNPLILISPDVPSSDLRQSYKFMLIGGDGQATTLWSGVGSRAEGFAVGDTHGVWFVIASSDGNPSHQALYLWTPQKGARLIAGLDGNIANIIAGTCA